MAFGTSIQGAFGALSTSAKETPVPRSSFLPTSQSWSSPFSAATETYRKNMSSYLGSPGSGIPSDASSSSSASGSAASPSSGSSSSAISSSSGSSRSATYVRMPRPPRDESRSA